MYMHHVPLFQREIGSQFIRNLLKRYPRITHTTTFELFKCFWCVLLAVIRYLGSPENGVLAGVVRIVFAGDLQHSRDRLVVRVQDVSDHFRNLCKHSKSISTGFFRVEQELTLRQRKGREPLPSIT